GTTRAGHRRNVGRGASGRRSRGSTHASTQHSASGGARPPPRREHELLDLSRRDQTSTRLVRGRGDLRPAHPPTGVAVVGNRAAQEQAKFDKLVRFGEALPAIRAQLVADLDTEPLSRAWTCAVAVRLVNLTWFRPGDDRYRSSYGVTTLRKGHVKVSRNKISF